MKIEASVCRYIQKHRGKLLEELARLRAEVDVDDMASVILLTDDIRDAWYDIDLERYPLRAVMALFILLNNILPITGYCREGSLLRGLLEVEGELEASRFERFLRQRLEMDRRGPFPGSADERSGCLAVQVTSDLITYQRKIWIEELGDYDIFAEFRVELNCSYFGKTLGDVVRTIVTLRKYAGDRFAAALELPQLWQPVTTGRVARLREARKLARKLFEGLSPEQIGLLTEHNGAIAEAFKAAAEQ